MARPTAVPWRNRAEASTVNGTLMTSTEIRSRGLVGVLAALLLLSLALLSHPAGAAKRKPREKLYSISLTATVEAATTESREGARPPYGCKGRSTETFRYSDSGHTSPAPKNVPLIKHGRFRYFDFPGQLTGLSASLTEDVTGSWEFDPTLPFAPDPSVCVFQPTHTVSQCQFDRQQDGFELFPLPGDGGRFTLTYEAPRSMIECPSLSYYSVPSDFFDSILTSLRLNSVLALHRHHSAGANGRVSRPLTSLAGGPIGTETVSYAVEIKRVR